MIADRRWLSLAPSLFLLGVSACDRGKERDSEPVPRDSRPDSSPAVESPPLDSETGGGIDSPGDSPEDTEDTVPTDTAEPDYSGAPEGRWNVVDAADIVFEDDLRTTGDYDGDGVQDYFVISELDYLNYVIPGPVDSLVSIEAGTPWIATLEIDPAWSGYPEKSGDVDGDAFDDLIVPVYLWTRSESRIYVFAGPMSGEQEIGTDTATATLTCEGALRTGESISLGDTDLDGRKDILVGDSGYPGSGYVTEPGVAYLVLGPTTGTSSLGDSDSIVEGPFIGSALGVDVEMESDLDASGTADVVLPAPGDLAHDLAAIYVFLGPLASGTLAATDADAIVEDFGSGCPLGTSSGGDIEGDGYDDFAVGDCGDSAVVVRVFNGPLPERSSYENAPITIKHDRGDSLFGYHVSIGQDLDADGHDDILIGASHDWPSAYWTGGVYVFYGPVSGTVWSEDADAVIRNRREKWAFEWGPGWGKPAGDANQDGFEDFITYGWNEDLTEYKDYIIFGGER